MTTYLKHLNNSSSDVTTEFSNQDKYISTNKLIELKLDEIRLLRALNTNLLIF